EESLAAEKEQLAVTLRSIGDGVITTDIHGTVILINKAAEELTGYTQEEAVGKPLHAAFHIISERTRIPRESPVDKVLNQGTVVGLGNNTVLISKDGTERIIADSGAPIRDRTSKIIGVVLVFCDITEKRKMEQDLLRAQKLESVGILAGGIAHDFNNILTAILGNANLAKMYAADNKIKEKLTKIEKASLQAKDLTQQLLTFSKGGAPVKKTTSIRELIKDSASFALRGSNVRCHFYIPDDLWPVDIDEGQISQTISNIIMNADQAMPEGGVIQVRAENVVVTAKQQLPLLGKYIEISIADQGVGIPEKHLDKIFDPYFTTKQKGSGLGLATTYSIVKKHNGHITAESKVGEGTTFRIWLPASRKIFERKEKTPSKMVGGEGRILLMDDEESILEAAGEVLQHLGYTVEVARDGEEAVDIYAKALEEEPFDAVIMDLTIPGGMGGKEALSRLMEIDPSVKAIVSSGYSTSPIMADYKKYGFKGVVAKPYSVEELSEILHQILGNQNENEND
ncbi:MAG: PAS domain S-box protein, partial [Theionarchaea archaeon]|nr:PAS domain S-box protein [Theionarchaea archaeon]